jgi:hypothetical protein
MSEISDLKGIHAAERIERAMWESLCRAAPDAFAREFGMEVHPFGPVLLTLCTAVDQGWFNRLVGLGSDPAGDVACIAEAAKRFRAAGLRNPFVQIPPANPHLDEAARSAGLVPYKRPWVKFAHGQAEPPQPETSVEIAPVSRKDATHFGDVVCAGYGLPPAFSQWHAALVDRPGWSCYLAWDKGEAIAAAAMFLHADGAWLGVAATRPDTRRRGSQSALLRQRIADARTAGAALITTETGKPLEGEDHPSYRNIVRSGFVPIYERPNWTFS